MCWIIEYVFGPAVCGAVKRLWRNLVYAPDLKSGTPLGFAGSIPARRTVHDQLLEVVMFFGVVYFFVLHLFALWGLFAAADWWVRRD